MKEILNFKGLPDNETHDHTSVRPAVTGIYPILLVVILGLIMFIIAAGADLYRRSHLLPGEEVPPPANGKFSSEPLLGMREVAAYTLRENSFELPEGYSVQLVSPQADFLKIDGNKVTLTPAKYDTGTITLDSSNLKGDRMIYKINVTSRDFDTGRMRGEINDTLGENAANYGVFVLDLLSGKSVSINPALQIPPGSICKLPIAALVLRDIDSGRRKLTDTYPIQNAQKHSTTDYLGNLPQGTQVSIDTYLRELILSSNNTAQYHLREMLGSTGVMNERIVNELLVNPFFEDPHIATAGNVAKLLRGIYDRSLVSDSSARYLIDLMLRTGPSLREAIPLALHGKPDTAVANKVGFLYGGIDSVYNDAAIVYAPATDYVIVVMNRSAPAFPAGKFKIQEIAAIVHNYFD